MPQTEDKSRRFHEVKRNDGERVKVFSAMRADQAIKWNTSDKETIGRSAAAELLFESHYSRKWPTSGGINHLSKDGSYI